jgi:hypothetical protein
VCRTDNGIGFDSCGVEISGVYILYEGFLDLDSLQQSLCNVALIYSSQISHFLEFRACLKEIEPPCDKGLRSFRAQRSMQRGTSLEMY